jgi:hypothetical protein
VTRLRERCGSLELQFCSSSTSLTHHRVDRQTGSSGSGDQGAPRPPVVNVRPEIAPPSPEANRKRLLADLQELITETQTLQRDLQAALGTTVSVESLKRSQRIEMLSKRIRKTLKAN